MLNFEFCCPTKVVFGKGSIAKLSELIDNDKKILMIYGGGSIMKNGVYNQVKVALNDFNMIEFGGIEPNPTYETCMEAVKIVKKEKINFLLAVGGGSVLDATKFIAAAAKYKGEEPYDIISKCAPFDEFIPFGSVITLPATGSEMNANTVISRKSTQEKLALQSGKLYPTFSIIDPEVTFTLPTKQTVNGIVDTFVHVMEQYATYDVNSPLQDSWALGLIKTLINESPKVLTNPKDYEARANIFWCATCGLNFWLSCGLVQDWATHRIGHELTALYGLDHGQSLAIILPRLWQYKKKDKAKKLAKMARDVYGCVEKDELKAADYTIKKTEEFFNSIGMKTKLSDYGINPQEAAKIVKERLEQRKVVFGENNDITPQVAYEVLLKC
ncbi:MAG TPA: iron-containing alcohol dehydrogenase [Candidatus Gastranaerophilaceae bacterium]|nr:iron-containing alcohol dehydrogenase [Candidatus Gastranaerophilaceae bacterium]HPT40984.1 iron-containing alcohol dehydrogenase [Candidatus Gastranaerophilaceae bacterium]